MPITLKIILWHFLLQNLLLFARKWNWRRGEMFLFYIFWYSLGRFFIESLRTDSLYLIGDLRSAQVVSIIGIVAAIALFVYRRLNVTPVVRYLDK